MYQLDHVVATGKVLYEAAAYLSKRLGFTLARGRDERHLRVVFADGYIDLAEDPFTDWHWSSFVLAAASLGAAEQAGLKLGEPLLTPEGTVRDLIADAAPDTLPFLLERTGSPRPQDDMEPARAAAVVQHANSAVALAGVMLLVPELEPAVRLYEGLLGAQAGDLYEDSVLGIEGRDIPFGNGKRVSIVRGNIGTGSVSTYQHHAGSGIFALIIKVRSLKAAAEALRQGAVYGFYNERFFFTNDGLPGYGSIMFEE